MYTTFEKVLYSVKPAPEEKITGLYAFITDNKSDENCKKEELDEVLKFGIENGCFTKEQANTLREGLMRWYKLEDGTWEWKPDRDDLDELEMNMGADWEEFCKWKKEQDEGSGNA